MGGLNVLFLIGNGLRSRKVLPGDRSWGLDQTTVLRRKTPAVGVFILDRSLLLPRLKNSGSGCKNVDR